VTGAVKPRMRAARAGRDIGTGAGAPRFVLPMPSHYNGRSPCPAIEVECA